MTSERPIDLSPPAVSSAAGPSAQPLLGKKQWVMYVLILLAVGILPYVNSLRNSFVYDDYDQVLMNPYLRNFSHLREIFTTSVWSFEGDFRRSTNYYRPMMSLGYLVCYQAFGPHALGFHMVNLLANLGVVLLVFLVTLRMFRSPVVALVSACIFALHPVHTEAVDWIAAVTELELAVFYLLTFWFFLGSARPGGKCSIPLQIAMAASFLLALLSKEQALTLPLLAALYEHLFRDDRGETSRAQKIWRYGALSLLTAVYLVVRTHFLGALAPSHARGVMGIAGLALSALDLIGRYGWKLVWPVELCAYYLFPTTLTPLVPWALRGLAALTLCAALFLALWKRNRLAAFGMIWLLAMLTPVLNVRWMASNPYAERYLYLASVGFCWMAGWAGVRGWELLSRRGPLWRIALPVAAGLLATLCILRIIVRNRDWRDNVTFYTATLAVTPDAYYMHNNLGAVYWGQGNIPAAEKEWRLGLALAPGSEFILHNLGLVADKKKNYREAEVFYLRALAVRPNYTDAHLDLGITYEATGRLKEAEAQLRTAEKLSPLNIRAHNTLSEYYLDRRQLDEAEAEARRSVEIVSTPQGNWDLGLAEWLKGDRQGAERAFLDAEAINPGNSRAHFMLGLLYMDSNRYDDAVREYRAGLQIDPNNADAYANLKKLEFMAGQTQ